MGLFALRFFILNILLIVLGSQEFKKRKNLGLPIQGWREFINNGSRWMRSRSSPLSALIFASLSYLCFSMWESLILSTLGVFSARDYLIIPGIGIVAYFIKKRGLLYRQWSPSDILFLGAGIGVLLGTVFCWIFLAWVYWRSLFLSQRSSAQ